MEEFIEEYKKILDQLPSEHPYNFKEYLDGLASNIVCKNHGIVDAEHLLSAMIIHKQEVFDVANKLLTIVLGNLK